MRNFKVTVNGNTYDVSVEDVSADAVTHDFGAAPNPHSSFRPTPREHFGRTPHTPDTSAPTGGEGNVKVKSPMPGNIVDIKVSVGDKVEANSVVVVLEAMKMENEIVTPSSGTVVSVNVSKGSSVNTDDVLITISE